MSCSEWLSCEIGDVVTLSQGLAINKKTDHLLSDVGLPLLRIKDLIEDKSVQFVDENLAPKKCIVNKNEIIFTRTGQVGLVFTGKDGVLHNNSFKVTPINTISVKYLYWFLKDKRIHTLANNLASGSVQKDLPHKAFNLIRFTYPEDINEQERIGDLLYSIQNKIELNNQMNEILEEIAQTLFKRWFVDFEFPNEEGLPYKSSGGEMVPSELGEIPKGWEVVELNTIIEINPKCNLKKGDETSYIEMKGLDENHSKITGIIKRPFSGSGTKFRNGDTLMARITPCLENGKTGYVNSLEEGEVAWGSTEFNVLRSKGNTPLELTYFLARNKVFRNFAITNMNGSSGRQRVNGKILGEYKIAFKYSEILNEFGKQISAFMSLIKKNNLENEKLTKTRDLLLPKLMSGEIRV